jgi:hypothetical protein
MPWATLCLANRSKGELFEEFEGTLDYALPQDWLNQFAAYAESVGNVTYDMIRATTVWTPDGFVTRCREVFDVYQEWTK